MRAFYFEWWSFLSPKSNMFDTIKGRSREFKNPPHLCKILPANEGIFVVFFSQPVNPKSASTKTFDKKTEEALQN